MSVELINRITVKKDGVYISSKSSNCSEPYRSNLIPSLSEIYKEKGEKALTKELIQMFMDYCAPRGTHRSIQIFASLPNRLSYKKAYSEMIDKKNAAWDKLSEEDKNTRWKQEQTPAMEKYMRYCQEIKDEFLESAYNIYHIVEESFGN